MSRKNFRGSPLVIAGSVVGVIAVALCVSRLSTVHAQGPVLPPGASALGSLRGVRAPDPGNLATFVKDKQAAIALGKALFWDMAFGSDGAQTCASCHFAAGADNRATNQLNPGGRAVPPDSTFQVGGGNYTLRVGDFPFFKPGINNDVNAINDVVSSQ